MKKYKLIKEYPGSPKLDTVIISTTIGSYDTDNNLKTYTIWGINKNCDMGKFRLNNPEDYKEFWEEIIEKDYEILSFVVTTPKNALKIGDTIEKIGLTNMFTGRSIDGISFTRINEKNLLKDSNWSIKSVKRLSDGEVFTIGDWYQNAYGRFQIDSFSLERDTIWVKAKEFGECRLQYISKVKEKLFTTFKSNFTKSEYNEILKIIDEKLGNVK